MNKYEKRFVILDLFCTGTILGWCIYTTVTGKTILNLVYAITMAIVYLLWLRPSIWNKLENQELEERLKNAEVSLQEL